MELNFTILELRFSSSPPLSNPTVRVRVSVSGLNASEGAGVFFDITLPLPAQTAPRDLGAVGAEALRTAQAIVHGPAAQEWLDQVRQAYQARG